MPPFNLFGKPPASQQSAGADPKQGGDSMNLAQLVTLMESAVKRVEAMQSQVDSLNSRVDQAVSSIGDRVNPAQQPAQEPQQQASRLEGLSEEDLAQLSRRELYALQKEDMMNTFTEAVKEILSPVDQRLQGIETSTSQSRVQTEMDKFLGAKTPEGKPKHADWEAYAPMMNKILENSSGISIADAYTLAKNRLREADPNKFAEIEAKFFPKEPKQEQEFSFGGLRTVSHSSAPNDNSLSLDDALEVEAKRFFDEHGAIPETH